MGRKVEGLEGQVGIGETASIIIQWRAAIKWRSGEPHNVSGDGGNAAAGVLCRAPRAVGSVSHVPGRSTSGVLYPG